MKSLSYGGNCIIGDQNNWETEIMKTHHDLFFSDSRKMFQIGNASVNLILTSPSYPMIEMWDSLYGHLNPKITGALLAKKGDKAFELMHKELDKTWLESYRVLKEGGIMCVNIGDATRTIGNKFQLYSNHSRIIQACKKIGFDTLPTILWHKKTNSPNKFMGSGMLPSGAYVTLEHEYILVFRKGSKRIFKTTEEKDWRMGSSFFWEERNKWFSDIWFDLPGVSQSMSHKSLRNRSAAFPFELVYRLICMYSMQSDTVLDPFLGTGTTSLAAMCAGRNSVGIEIDKTFGKHIINRLTNSVPFLNNRISQRLLDHIKFMKEYLLRKKFIKYENSNYGFPVVTRQETLIQFPYVESIRCTDNRRIFVEYSVVPEIRRIDQTEELHHLELRT